MQPVCKACNMKQQAILSLKGVINEEGGEKAVALRVDGIIASNHGGRQIGSGLHDLDCRITIALQEVS